MSRETKRQAFWFQVDDTEAIAHHLEKMEAKGWKLEAVDNWYYHFRRSEPAQVRYAVTYFPDASIFDPKLPEGQETYAGYCEAAGWELAAFYGPIQYFRSIRENPAPIETDESIKLDAVRRTMRKTYVLSYASMLLIPLVYFPAFFALYRRDPMDFFSSSRQILTLLMMAGIALFGIAMLLDYLFWIVRSRRSIARGGGCVKPHTRARLWGSGAVMALCILLLVNLIFQGNSEKIYYVLYIAVYGGIMLLARWVLKKLKQRSENRSSVVAGYMCFGIAAVLIVALIVTFALPPLMNAFQPPQEEYIYTNPNGGSITWTVYHDELPVTWEDLGVSVTPEDHCSYQADVQESCLAFSGKYQQQVLNLDSRLGDLRYQVYRTSWRWLLERQWENLLAKEADSPFPLEEISPAAWGAEAVYKQRDLEGYYLRWPDMVMYIHFSDAVEQARLERLVLLLRERT